MNRNSCQMMIKACGEPGVTRLLAIEANERLDVLDLSTRATLRVRAGDVSLYRHTLVLEGRAYDILSLVKPH